MPPIWPNLNQLMVQVQNPFYASLSEGLLNFDCPYVGVMGCSNGAVSFRLDFYQNQIYLTLTPFIPGLPFRLFILRKIQKVQL